MRHAALTPDPSPKSGRGGIESGEPERVRRFREWAIAVIREAEAREHGPRNEEQEKAS